MIIARTESKSIQCHQNNEQEQIDLMQKFHWSLIGNQTIKTVDNHLERRSDDIYQSTNTEHFVKLTFSRDIDLPNLSELKRLEDAYFRLPEPIYPKLLYFFFYYRPKKAEAEHLANANHQKR